VIAALLAVEDPHDPVALVGALRSPFFGFSDAALLRFRQAGGEWSYLRPLPPGLEPAWAEAWRVLGALHRDRNRVAPPALVERLYAETQVLAAYALEPDGEARVANLLKVLDTARALEATGIATFRGLVRWLRDRGAARYEEEESSLADEEDDVVRLMTIHKAKGLQFDVVVLPDLAARPPARPGRLLVDRASGSIAVSLGEVGGEPLGTLDWATAEAAEGLRADAEAVRLLYVAMTRARRELILPVPPLGRLGGFADLLLPLLDGAEPVPLDPAPAAGPAGPAAPVDVDLDGWRRGRAALHARGATSRPVLRPSAAGPAGGGAGGAGARVGALVHAALATADLGRPDDVLAVAGALGARDGVPDRLVARAARLLRRALASPVLERARRAEWLAREVPVTAEVGGALVEGRADLVFAEAGGLVVVEVKTDADPGGGEQVGLYAEALARALGRPVREAVVLRLSEAPGAGPRP
jgi:ATP-dependent helicase/nuclease subunit A